MVRSRGTRESQGVMREPYRHPQFSSAHWTPVALLAITCFMLEVLFGCGGSPEQMQLSQEARKVIDRRKVDVENRPAKSKPRALKPAQPIAEGRP
jgi:hypothetical protein